MNHKRQRQDDDDESVGNSAPESNASKQPVKPKKSTTSKRKEKTAKKPKYDASEFESSPVHEDSKQQAVKVLQNAEGDKYVDLGKNKHASVRVFKGAVFLDIREFYDGKPQKKGITLSNEQWGILKQGVSTIDSFFAEHGKK